MSTISLMLVVIGSLISLNNANPVVDALVGKIKGSQINGVKSFRGIPYAKAPIEQRRFAPPEPTDAWDDDTLDTTLISYVPACPMNCAGGPPFCPVFQSEDCLFLNVYTPSSAEYGVTEYPTMIYIHGGKFDEGWSTWFLYDPSSIIANTGDVIVVTINYRLGILGNLYDNIFNTGVEGNFGYLDQKLAIKWVHDNIAYFGGNPNNINLFGESAGAQYTGLHLLYNDDGYIKKGIMQSAPFGYELRTPTTWKSVPVQFSQKTGCSQHQTDPAQLLACWRQRSVVNITAPQNDPAYVDQWANPIEIWTPTVETELFPDQPVLAKWSLGQWNTPPFIIGLNTDEQLLFLSPKSDYTFQDLVDRLNLHFNYNDVKVNRILEHYGVTETNTPNGGYKYDEVQILNDQGWKCATQKILKETKNNYGIYQYSFEVVDPAQNGFLWYPVFPQCIPKACHVAELFYLFLPPLYQAIGFINEDTKQIGYQMQTFWRNFAWDYNPNGNGPNWPMYTNQGPNKEQFLRILGVGDYQTGDNHPDANDCNFWDSIGYAGDY